MFTVEMNRGQGGSSQHKPDNAEYTIRFSDGT